MTSSLAMFEAVWYG